MRDFIHKYEYLERKKELYGKEKVYVKALMSNRDIYTNTVA
ncbi:hypothetical protein [Alkalibacillus silvisoli]|uniref:Uncharacterized protein n=1 Tax=Alkalibacillus silvisoli TaxID=392823 RepID=A0ABP3JGW1_9BACI